MTVGRNTTLDDGNSVREALQIAYGTDELTPDAGGGFLFEALPGFTGCEVVVSYDTTLFTPANAGFLKGEYDSATGRVHILSSNVADDNFVRWIAIR